MRVAKLIEQSVEGWLGSRKEEASSALELVALSDSQVFLWLAKLNSKFVFQGIHLDYRALTICPASKNPSGRCGQLLVHIMLEEL